MTTARESGRNLFYIFGSLGSHRQMRDPHVTRLEYSIGTEGNVACGAPPRYAMSNAIGTFSLKDGALVVEPATHYPSATAARMVVDPFLRAWEVEADLTRYAGSIRFRYSTSDVVDRTPPPPSQGITIEVGVGELLVIGETASVSITQNSYPPAPVSFRVTPEVDIAHARWLAFRAQREPLQSMAYSILTLIEKMAGNRKAAASTFCIDEAILREIGRLASTKGDGATARKLCEVVSLDPMSGGESSWLEAAVRQVIHRLGEHAAGGQLAQVTMDQLPQSL